MANTTCYPLKFVKLVPTAVLHKDIKNISAHYGLCRPDFLRPLVVQIIALYPDELKGQKIPHTSKSEIKITGLGKVANEHLTNIAYNLRIGREALIKAHLPLLFSKIPAYMKMPMPD